MMLSLSIINYFDRTILSVAAPAMMKEFSLSPTSMGAVFSAFLVSYTLLMTPGGRWSDRFGPRNMLAITALGSGLLTALMPLGGTPGLGSFIGVIPGLVVVRLGFGIFTAPLFPAAARMNAISMPPLQRARVLGFVNAGAGFGGAVSPILFSAMLARFGWRPSFVMAGLAAVLLGVLWLATVPDSAAETRAGDRPRWGALLSNRNMRWLIAGFAALDYYEYIFFYWLFYYLGEVRKLSADDTALYTTLPFLAWVLMMPLGGWLADRLVARHGVKQGLRWVAIGALTHLGARLGRRAQRRRRQFLGGVAFALLRLRRDCRCGFLGRRDQHRRHASGRGRWTDEHRWQFGRRRRAVPDASDSQPLWMDRGPIHRSARCFLGCGGLAAN